LSTDDELFGPGRSRAFSPFLAAGERKQLHDLLNLGSDLPPSSADELRALARRYVDDGDSIKLRTICLLVADLCEQGWRVLVDSDRITFEPPGITRKQPKDGRSNLRLSSELWSAIDKARDKRPGNVSRNTWLIEAITEKLANEQQNITANDAPHV
jgi:hypothetical protein